MKKLFFITFISLQALLQAQQVPQGINYQAIIRNPTTNAVLTNTAVDIQFYFYYGNDLSTVIFKEQHPPVNTGALGVINLIMGNGTAIVSGTSFSANINWANTFGVFYEVRLNLGSGYNTIASPQKFMSVPYALYAVSSGTNSIVTPTITGTGLAIVTPSTGTTFTVNVPKPNLGVNNGSLTITAGNYTNSIDISNLGLWTRTSNTISPKIATDNVYIKDTLILGPTGGKIGDVLTKTSLAGVAEWKSPVAFSLSASTMTLSSNLTNTLVFNNIDYGNNMTSNSTFTAPVAGIYHFEGAVAMIPSPLLTADLNLRLQIMVNNATNKVSFKVISLASSIQFQISVSADIKLNALDKVYLTVLPSSRLLTSPTNPSSSPNWHYFTGHKIN